MANTPESMQQKVISPARRGMIAIAAVLVFLFGNLYLPGHALASDLPDLGDPSATVLSPEEDQRLGQAFMRSLRQQVTIIEDPELNAYINSLGYRLLAAADSSLPFTFFIVDDPSINAFAGPGGHIGIHSGLILAAQSEGELAAVMAHEIAHVTQRHLARAFQKASTVQLQTAAAILAAIILGSPQLSSAMITSAAAGNIQQQLNFTRSHEQEADRVGIEILADSGYAPEHMPGFFQRLQEAYRYNESSLPELLRTHPVTPNRIADSQNRVNQMPKIKETVSASFPYIQARLRAMNEQQQQYRLQELEARLTQAGHTMSRPEEYEYALFQLKLGRFDEAEKYSQKLLALAPEEEPFIALQAQIEIETNRPAQAIERLQQALQLFPHQAQLTVLHSKAQLQAGNAKLAADIMRELIQRQQQFLLPAYHQQLAHAEFAADRKSHAYLAMAEYYYMLGQTRSAVDQLETALNHTPADSTFLRQRISAQLEKLKEEVLAERDSRKRTEFN